MAGKKLCVKLCFVFSVQVCVNPWTVLRQADLRMYLFLGGKGMFLCFYVKKIVPVDMASDWLASRKYYGSTSTKKLRIVNTILVLTPLPTTKATRTTTASPLHPSPVIHMTQVRAGAGVGAWPIAATIPPCACNGATTAPTASDGSKDVLCLPPSEVESCPCHRPWPYGGKHSSLKAAIR